MSTPTPQVVANTTSRVRYGVFLRPSPELIEEVLRGYQVVVHQCGFTAAKVYPPHLTLVGSIALAPGVEEEDLTHAVETVLAGFDPLALVNTGLEQADNGSIGYQIEDAEGVDSDQGVRSLMGSIVEAVTPLRIFPPTDLTVQRLMELNADTFHPHISLLSHDGRDNVPLAQECFEVLRALGIGEYREWTGTVVTLYRFHSDEWSGRYWESMTWKALHTWNLT